MTWQLDINGGETPHEHVVGVAPGDKCPTCERRLPHPKRADSPLSKVFAYRVPIDDAETHGEILDAAATELGIFSEPHHRFRLALYGATLILQGARLTETDRTDEGDWCIRCGQAAVHTHHRKLRSQGGGNEPANLIRLCLECHDWVHHNPADAYATGYLVKSWQNPEDVQVGG